jgi:FkbM family methyltransferase
MNFSGIRSASVLGKLLRWPLHLVPASAQVRIVQGPLRGKKWIAGSSNHGCWLGSYEYEKQNAFCKELRKGAVVYDLGANVGFYSLLASTLVGTEGLVCSFEPSPRNLAFLRKHIELNRVSNCRILDVAVSSSDGAAYFSLGSHNAQGHLIGSEADHTVKVKTVKLDTLVFSQAAAPPDLVKCDIEGGEYEALKGAERTLRQFSPVIFLATHGQEVHQRCCAWLRELGYDLKPLGAPSLSEADEIIARHPRASSAPARSWQPAANGISTHPQL